MEALRIIKNIKSDRLPELNKYKGRKVEIIILPDIDNSNVKENNTYNQLLNLRGSLKTKIDGLEFQKRIREEWNR